MTLICPMRPIVAKFLISGHSSQSISSSMNRWRVAVKRGLVVL